MSGPSASRTAPTPDGRDGDRHRQEAGGLLAGAPRPGPMAAVRRRGAATPIIRTVPQLGLPVSLASVPASQATVPRWTAIATGSPANSGWIRGARRSRGRRQTGIAEQHFVLMPGERHRGWQRSAPTERASPEDHRDQLGSRRPSRADTAPFRRNDQHGRDGRQAPGRAAGATTRPGGAERGAPYRARCHALPTKPDVGLAIASGSNFRRGARTSPALQGRRSTSSALRSVRVARTVEAEG